VNPRDRKTRLEGWLDRGKGRVVSQEYITIVSKNVVFNDITLMELPAGLV
jgi:hypothetical protein